MTAVMHSTRTAPAVVAVRPRSLVVLAGLPGAGKTTLLSRLDADEPVAVLDSDQVRELISARVALPYRSYRLFVHLIHRFRVFLTAFTAPGLVVVHEPSTRPGTRAMLALIGLLSGRPRHFLWLDVSAAEALDGQIARGRMVRTHTFERHVRRGEELRSRFVNGTVPSGFSSLSVITRAGTARGLRITT